MKAQELRIGNLVNSSENEQIIINGIFEAGIHNQDFNGYPYEMLQPIPATEEWLLRFGFIKHTGWDDFEYFDKNGVHIYVCNEWFEYEMELKIESVHQLQNLYFTLTQKELC